MANYCYNKVAVNGKKEDLKSFLSFINKYKIAEEVLNPEIFTDFNLKDLGARWIDFHLEENIDDGWITLHGDSAWVPPTYLYDLFAEQFPNLYFTIDFEEMGNDLGGWKVYEEGELLEDHFYGYWEYKVKRDVYQAIEDFIEYENESYEDYEDFIENADILNHVQDRDYLINLVKEAWKF